MKKLSILSLVFILFWTSCDITGLNENTQAPVDISANPLFSNAQLEIGRFIGMGANYFGFKMYPQHWAATQDRSRDRYILGSEPDNTWSRFYGDILISLKDAKNKFENNEELTSGVKANKLACIEVMQVLAYSYLVDIFGNVPYSEALDPENTQPSFDDAQQIYMDLLSRLNTAIDNFDSSVEGFGSADIIYNGDISKWEKFANSIKMRLAINISDVNSSKAQTVIEEASPNAFTSNADNAKIRFQSATPNTNPSWVRLVQSGRTDNVPSNSFISRLNDRNDPRRSKFFTTHNGIYIGGENGTNNDYEDYSHFSEIIRSPDLPASILNYEEVEFIRAEAAARGFNVSGSATGHYENGIRADMEEWNVAESEINAYLAQSNVAYSSASGDYHQKIGLQKWISFHMQGLRAWTLVRRLDTPDLDTPVGAIIDELMKRYEYPIAPQNLNEASYEEAAEAIGGDNLTTKIFWDV
jgi:hypothetical protein